MMYELFLKSYAHYLLGKMYHQSEIEKGFDVEYHKVCVRECIHDWNVVRTLAEKRLGKKVSMECYREARHLAESEFKKGNIFID